MKVSYGNRPTARFKFFRTYQLMLTWGGRTGALLKKNLSTQKVIFFFELIEKYLIYWNSN